MVIKFESHGLLLYLLVANFNLFHNHCTDGLPESAQRHNTEQRGKGILTESWLPFSGVFLLSIRALLSLVLPPPLPDTPIKSCRWLMSLREKESEDILHRSQSQEVSHGLIHIWGKPNVLNRLYIRVCTHTHIYAQAHAYTYNNNNQIREH